jgi:hypothetical protein
MGRRDIAELLVEHGARLDIFAAAMLGEVGSFGRCSMRIRRCATRSARTGSPCARAEKGGERATEVLGLLGG